MKLTPLHTSWDPPVSHQHFLLYLPASSKETRCCCCWCWFSSVLVKYISLSGFSPTRSISFDGLPKMRWKWNPLKWEQWSPKRQRSTRIAAQSHRSRQGPRLKQIAQRLQSLGLLPSTHVHTKWKQTDRAQVHECRSLLTLQALAILSPTQSTP